MIVYEIMFEGVGYDLILENNQRICGFYVTVIASAPGPEQAFEIAFQKLINSQAYQELVAENEHPNAELRVCQYREITAEDLDASEISGFVFYPYDEHSTRMMQ